MNDDKTTSHIQYTLHTLLNKSAGLVHIMTAVNLAQKLWLHTQGDVK